MVVSIFSFSFYCVVMHTLLRAPEESGRVEGTSSPSEVMSAQILARVRSFRHKARKILRETLNEDLRACLIGDDHSILDVPDLFDTLQLAEVIIKCGYGEVYDKRIKEEYVWLTGIIDTLQEYLKRAKRLSRMRRSADLETLHALLADLREGLLTVAMIPHGSLVSLNNISYPNVQVTVGVQPARYVDALLDHVRADLKVLFSTDQIFNDEWYKRVAVCAKLVEQARCRLEAALY